MAVLPDAASTASLHPRPRLPGRKPPRPWRVAIAALGMLAFCHPTNSSVFGTDTVLPMTYAIVEHCAEKFPEYAERNRIALARWRIRNESFVTAQERQDHFAETDNNADTER